MKYYFVVSIIFIVGCTNNAKNEQEPFTVGSGNDVLVTLNVENNKDIERIEFSSNGTLVSIKKNQILANNVFIYKFENEGEGTFQTCVYKLNDTICTESYVEKGYAPKMKFVNDSLIFIDFIGLKYD